MIIFTLPWPDPKLNPNRSNGGHWSSTSALRKSARAHARAMAIDVMRAISFAPGAAGPLPLTITFHQPDRRARDRDNLLAAMKPSLDGLADAMGVNDSQFEPVTLRRVYGGKPGHVQIEIGGQA